MKNVHRTTIDNYEYSLTTKMSSRLEIKGKYKAKEHTARVSILDNFP